MVTVNTSPSSPALSRTNSEPHLAPSDRCPRCHQAVRRGEGHVEVLSYEVQQQRWHSHCATCVDCRNPVQSNDSAVADSDQLYCSQCYQHHSPHTQPNAPATYPTALPSLSSLLTLATLITLVASLYRGVVYLVYLPYVLCSALYYDLFLGQILLYNCSFEDARIDRQLLDVKSKTVLTLTSAGDNVLDALTEGAARVIAVDQNVAQCSLMELKLACIGHLQYEQLWAIFGQCDGAVFRRLYPSSLRPHLSVQAQKFWDARQYYMDGFYHRGGSGVCGWLLVHVFCPLTGLSRMLDELMASKTLDAQREVYSRWRPYFTRVMCVLYYLGAWKFLAWLVAVPTNQQSLLSTNWQHYIEHVLDHICTRTHLASENHYYAIYVEGRYRPNNCPRYLQRRYFSLLQQNVHRVEMKCGNLFDVFKELAAQGQQVDRFNLLDSMDWMDEATVLYEWSLIANIAAPHSLALWKSISEISSPTTLGFLPTPTDAQDKIDRFMTTDCTPTYRSIRLVQVPSRDEMVFAPRNIPVIPNVTLSNDMRVLYAMYVAPVMRKLRLERGPAAVAPATGAAMEGVHTQSRQSMNTFYAPQAQLYDSYRHRMLHGRALMAACLPIKKGGIWVDVGGGTAFNLEYCADVLPAFERVYVVDVCDHLLAQAERRVASHGWTNVTCIQRDVCQQGILTPEEAAQGCDLVTFSYSLTMIPQWQEALEAAYAMLRPGGTLAITDFTVLPPPFQAPLLRSLFTRVFAIDGVRLSEAHRQHLVELLVPCVNEVRWGHFPYIPLLRCPYYVFVGRKPESAGKLIWKGSPVGKNKLSLSKRSMSGLMLADASLSS